MKKKHTVNKFLFLIITICVCENTNGMGRGDRWKDKKNGLYQIQLIKYATLPKPHSTDNIIQFLNKNFLAYDETDIFDRPEGIHPKQQQIVELIQGTSEEATTILAKDFFPRISSILSRMHSDTLQVIYEYLLPENNGWLTSIEDIWIQYANNPRIQDSIIITKLLCIMGKYTIHHGSNIPIKSAKIITMSLQLSQGGYGAGHDICWLTKQGSQNFDTACLQSWFSGDRFGDTTKLTLKTEIDVSTYFPYAIHNVNKGTLHLKFDPIQKINDLERQLRRQSSEFASSPLPSTVQPIISMDQRLSDRLEPVQYQHQNCDYTIQDLTRNNQSLSKQLKDEQYLALQARARWQRVALCTGAVGVAGAAALVWWVVLKNPQELPRLK